MYITENVLLKTDVTLHERGLEGVKGEVDRLDGLVLEIKSNNGCCCI